MTGGQGCQNYSVDVPQHCPGQTDNEYRSEISLYSVLGSPMMVGTDIRLMTAIMNETLINAEMLAVNQVGRLLACLLVAYVFVTNLCLVSYDTAQYAKLPA